MIDKLDHLWLQLPGWQKAVLDVIAHYFIALWILCCLAGLTFYLGNICIEMFIMCAALAILMIPIRIIAVRLLRDARQSHYLDDVLREVWYNGADVKKDDRSDLDDEFWFMRNY